MTDALIDTADALGLLTTKVETEGLAYVVHCLDVGDLPTALWAVQKVERDADRLTLHIVQRLRSQGKNWAQVGLILGVTRQAAHKRFADRCS